MNTGMRYELSFFAFSSSTVSAADILKLGIQQRSDLLPIISCFDFKRSEDQDFHDTKILTSSYSDMLHYNLSASWQAVQFPPKGIATSDLREMKLQGWTPSCRCCWFCCCCCCCWWWWWWWWWSWWAELDWDVGVSSLILWVSTRLLQKV